MTFLDILRTLLEIAMVVGLVWGIFNEDRLVAFEEKLLASLRRKRLRVAKHTRRRSFNV